MPADYQANQVHVTASGPEDGAAVVFLHSIATSGAMWLPQLPVWQKKFRILNVDLPGHGKSPAPAHSIGLASLAELLCTVLDGHQIQQAAIVGLSWGGMIAQALALTYPKRVRALVLAHTSARLPEAAQELWAERITATLAEGIESQIPSTIARWFTPAFRERAPLTVRWVEQMITETDPHGFVGAAMTIRDLDFLDRLSAVEAPALIVSGRHDTAAPMPAAEAMLAALPNARLEVLDSAHLGNIEQPLAFTEIVGAHLERTA